MDSIILYGSCAFTLLCIIVSGFELERTSTPMHAYRRAHIPYLAIPFVVKFTIQRYSLRNKMWNIQKLCRYISATHD